MNIALIIAGGSGQRMHQDVPKQFLTVNNKPVIVYTMEAFQNNPEIDVISVVCLDGWDNVLQAYAKQFNITKLKHIFPGGKNGQSSIRSGVFELRKIYDDDDLVLVHDAIRPMVSQEIITDCIIKTKKYGNAIASIPTLEAVLETSDGIVSQISRPRNLLKRTQTPQGFSLKNIYDMHVEALDKGITDSVASCTLAVELGKKVYISLGSEKNIKLTTPEDLDIFRALLTTEKMGWIK